MTVGRSQVLVGREAEFRTLREAATQAGRPGAVAVVVEGEPGIGKSRLVAELTSELISVDGAGALVGAGHGINMGQGAVAYGVAAEVLTNLASQIGVRSLRRILGAQLNSIRFRVPELGHPEHDLGARDRLAVYSTQEAASCCSHTRRTE